ncbi:MAG: dihydrofolate reductase family protein [Nitrospira sp.]|nr:dihydrofolate reductase family protein [Nitrospira sp.]
MRKVVAHLIMTLDGVVEFDVVADTIVKLRDTEEVLGDFFPKVAEEDAMLLGRVSYQEWADYWPTSTSEPFASHINNVPKYVVSKTLDSAPWGSWESAMLIRGSLADAVTTLKQQPGKNIGIHASPTLVESMLHSDLLDELRLEIYPVVAGSGARLFHDGRAIKYLRLADSKITKNGVAILTYESVNNGNDA